jgi:hypothetical protein
MNIDVGFEFLRDDIIRNIDFNAHVVIGEILEIHL